MIMMMMLMMIILTLLLIIIIKKGKILGYILACMVCAVCVNIIILNSALS